MIKIEGLKEHEQSLLLTLGNEIEAHEATLETIMKEDTPDLKQIHEYKHNIENAKEKLRTFSNELAKDFDSKDAWITYVLEGIDVVEGYLYLLPEDISKIIKAIMIQVKKILSLIKELGD